MTDQVAIHTAGLTKHYGSVHALAGVRLYATARDASPFSASAACGAR